MQFPLGSSEGTYSCQIHSLRGSCGTPGKQHCQSNLDLFKSLELALKTAIYMLSITCCLSQVLVSQVHPTENTEQGAVGCAGRHCEEGGLWIPVQSLGENTDFRPQTAQVSEQRLVLRFSVFPDKLLLIQDRTTNQMRNRYLYPWRIHLKTFRG